VGSGATHCFFAQFFSRHHHRQILRTGKGSATTAAKITAIPAYNALSLVRFIIPIADAFEAVKKTYEDLSSGGVPRK
jgi:hypothetical protein